MWQRLYQALFRSTVGRLERAIGEPVAAQNKVLIDLVRAASQTSFGRKHGFTGILESKDPIREFQARVPLGTFDDLAPWLERTRAGEADVLWPGVVTDFAISSGTSRSTNKELPVTGDLFRHFNRFAQTLIGCHIIEQGSIRSVRGLPVAFTSTIVADELRPEARVGQVSGLVAARSRRSWLRNFFSRPIPQAIIEAATLDEKIDRFVEYSLDRDVRMMAMIPWLVLRFLDRASEIYCGKTGNRSHSPASKFWPNLDLVICGGQPLSLYRDSIQRRIGARPVSLIEMYGASESMFALQMRSDDRRLFLHPDNRVFFEFVPYSPGESTQQRHTVADVECDRAYVMHISTCGGLWGYSMDDVVRFTSLNPHCIEVLGRASEILELQPGRLTGVQIRQALQRTGKETGTHPLAAHVCVQRESAGKYLEWLIEFDDESISADDFSEGLNRNLQSESLLWKEIVGSSQRPSLRVIPVPVGGFDPWVKTAAGGGHTQAKIPLVGNDTRIASELKRFLGFETRPDWS